MGYWFTLVYLTFQLASSLIGGQLGPGTINSRTDSLCSDQNFCSGNGTCYQASKSLNPYADPTCQPEWLKFNGSCLRFVWKLVGWNEAHETCIRHGANLFNATNTDITKLPDLFNLFKDVLAVMQLENDDDPNRPSWWTGICQQDSKTCSMITADSTYTTTENRLINESAGPLCIMKPTLAENPVRQCSCRNDKIGINCEDDQDGINYTDMSLCDQRISCPIKHRIRIDFAAFGQLENQKLCNSSSESDQTSKTTCYAFNTMYLLKYWCQGKMECNMKQVDFKNESILKLNICNLLQSSQFAFRYRRTCILEDEQTCENGDVLINTTSSLTCMRPVYGNFTWWGALEMCRSMGANLIFLTDNADETHALLEQIKPFELLHPPEAKIWIGAVAKNVFENKHESETCTHLQVDMVNGLITAQRETRNLQCDVMFKHYWLCKFQPLEGRNGCPHNATTISLDSTITTCYLLGQYKLMWGEARAKCHSLNGTLATFYESFHPSNSIFYKFISEALIALNQDYWIAGIESEHRPVNGNFQPCSRVKQDKSSTRTVPVIKSDCSFQETTNALCAYAPDISIPSNVDDAQKKALDNSFINQRPTDHVSYAYNSPNTASSSLIASKHSTESLSSLSVSSVTPRISLNFNRSKTTITNPLGTNSVFAFNSSSTFSGFPSDYDFPNTSTISTLTASASTISTLIASASINPISLVTSTVTNIPSTTANSAKDCNERIVHDPRFGEMRWSEAKGDSYQTQACPGKTRGEAKWYCDAKTGEFVPHHGPDLSNCSALQSGLIEELDQGVAPQNVAEELLDNFSTSMYGGDLNYIFNVAELLRTKQEELYTNISNRMRFEMAVNFTKTMADVFDNLMKENQSYAWLDISEEIRGEQSTRLLKLVDSICFSMAASLENSTFSIRKDNIDIYIINITQSNIQDLQYPDTSDTSIYLPASVLKAVKNSEIQAVFAKYQNMSIILPAFSYTGNSINSTLLQNSEVMSASIFNEVSFNENESVKVVFKHSTPLSNVNSSNASETACVFWNMSSSSGFWDNSGCTVAVHNQTHTVCLCNHLTNFAVLMDMNDVLSRDSDHYIALTWITIVGCTISIVCLSLSCIIFLAFRSLWNLRNSIHCNLCICLLISQIVLLAGLDHTESRIGCGITAGLLHYFWLASFVWMAAEGIMIYILLIKVFDTGEQKAWHYYTACYGIPAVIVLISVSCRWEGYGTTKYCWISIEDGLIFAFAAPLAVLVLFNIVILIMALKVASSVRLQRHQSKLEATRLWIKRAGSLVPLLGLTWVFGFLYFNESAIVFAYLFAIFNSIQGIFIFVFHCLRNEKVQQVITRYIAKKRERLDSLTFSGKSSRSNSCTATSTVRSVTSDTSLNGDRRTPTNKSNGFFSRGRVTPARWKYKLDISAISSTTDTKDYDIKDSLSSIPSKVVSNLVNNIDHRSDNYEPYASFFRVRSSSDVSC